MESGPPETVVVVSFNTCDKLRRCLTALADRKRVIVVDNASEDGSAEMVAAEFPAVRLIRNATNLGFGAANNQGLDFAESEIVLLLNSDAYAEPGAIDRLRLEFVDLGVVAAGGRLLNPDGTLQQSSANGLTLWAVFCEQTYLERLFPESRLFAPYWNSRRFHSAGDVEQVMGACLMLRLGAERFDERFFLYCEDTELCARLRERGRIRYVPEARFIHELGSSSAQRWEAVARYNRGKELYFALRRGPAAAFACFCLNRLGAMLRFCTWGLAAICTLFLDPSVRRKALLFLRVLFAPPPGPPRPHIGR